MNSSDQSFTPEEVQEAAPLQWPEVQPEDSFASALQQDLQEEPGDQPATSSETPPVPTAEELEEMQRAAFEEASREGHTQGYREGFDKGSQEGYKEGYDKGFQQGYREGREQGEKEGFEEARQSLNAEIGHFRQMMDLLAEPLSQLDEQVEQELVGLSMAVARQLVRRELKTDPGQIVAVVRDALALLPVSQRTATLTMHPEDAELVRSALHLDRVSVPWEIVEEPLISRGGCRVETEVSCIDATVESRLAAVIATALGSERSQDRQQQNGEEQ